MIARSKTSGSGSNKSNWGEFTSCSMEWSMLPMNPSATGFGGGARGYGAVFKLNEDGGSFAVLHSFSPTNNDGLFPYAGLTKGTNGEFYGSTSRGGKSGPSGAPSDSYGTIFVLRRAVSIVGVSVQPNGHAQLLFVGQGGKSYNIQAILIRELMLVKVCVLLLKLCHHGITSWSRKNLPVKSCGASSASQTAVSAQEALNRA